MIWIFLQQDKRKWLLNRGDRLGRFDCIHKTCNKLVKNVRHRNQSHCRLTITVCPSFTKLRRWSVLPDCNSNTVKWKRPTILLFWKYHRRHNSVISCSIHTDIISELFEQDILLTTLIGCTAMNNLLTRRKIFSKAKMF